MKQKMTALLTMLLMGATAVTGCSSTVEGKSGTSSTVLARSVASNTEPTVSPSDKLTLNGSTSMTKICQALGEGFMEEYPRVVVEKGGMGSGDTAEAVNNGTALIGDLSRGLKDEEKPIDFEIAEIAIDGIVTAINLENKVDALVSEQIAKVYTGGVSNWEDVGGVDQKTIITGHETASDIRGDFESILNIRGKTKLSAGLSSTDEVAPKVGSDSTAIGCISLGSVNQSIKIVTADNVRPSEETIRDGTYKFQGPFIEIYKKGSDNELVKAWLEFIDSSEGQQIIKDAGLIIK